MNSQLKLSIGQSSDKGRKEINQDFHGAAIPELPLLRSKGIAIAQADGIGSSGVSGIASESAVKGFLADYYCTPDSWSVKTSAQRVISATNSWLHAQTRRGPHAYDKDKGYVCTFSVLIARSATAHIFHIGDSRVYRQAGQALEQLTSDHRVVVSAEQAYLSRALGMDTHVEIDYRTVPLEIGDVFILATDGVHEYLDDHFATAAIAAAAEDLDRAAREIVQEALARGSPDNLTIQIVRIDALPDEAAEEMLEQAAELPLPPLPEPREMFDGYRIERRIHANSRSHIFLAIDTADGAMVALKVPSIDMRGDPAYLKRFMLEEWVARRIDSAHVLKARPPARKRNFLYTVAEFVDGQTLGQWMIDNPRPDLETVRGIVEQIARGLRAFHRMEMLHRDLRPENIVIDRSGTAKIIDFGSTFVTGAMEDTQGEILGTVQYSAPEYFLGEPGTPRSDMFSLGAIAYQMLTGKLPYGAEMAKARTKSRQRKVVYQTALDANREIPVWVDAVLRKAVHPDPYRRYRELSEFVYDLRHPNRDLLAEGQPALMERNPVLFWKTVSFVLFCAVVVLLAMGQ